MLLEAGEIPARPRHCKRHRAAARSRSRHDGPLAHRWEGRTDRLESGDRSRSFPACNPSREGRGVTTGLAELLHPVPLPQRQDGIRVFAQCVSWFSGCRRRGVCRSRAVACAGVDHAGRRRRRHRATREGGAAGHLTRAERDGNDDRDRCDDPNRWPDTIRRRDRDRESSVGRRLGRSEHRIDRRATSRSRHRLGNANSRDRQGAPRVDQRSSVRDSSAGYERRISRDRQPREARCAR